MTTSSMSPPRAAFRLRDREFQAAVPVGVAGSSPARSSSASSALRRPRSPPPRAAPRPAPACGSRPQPPAPRPPAARSALLLGLRPRQSPRRPLGLGSWPSSTAASLCDALGVDRLRLLAGGGDRRRDQLLVDAPAPLGDAGRLADPAAQVVELGPAHVAAGGDLEFLDLRRVQRERPLDADAEGLLADGEGLTRARALALEDDSLEDLGAAAVALDHLEVDAHAIARVEGGKALPQLAPLDAVDHAAHEVPCARVRWREKTAGPVPGAARLRNGTYSGPRSNCSARARLCATRHSRTRSWSPETRTSGTSQPR